MRVEGPRLVEAFIELLPIYSIIMVISSLPFLTWFTVYTGTETYGLTSFDNVQGQLYFITAVLVALYTAYGAYLKDLLKEKGISIEFHKEVKIGNIEFVLNDLTVIGLIISIIVLIEYISMIGNFTGSVVVFLIFAIILIYMGFMSGNYIRIAQVLLFFSWIFIFGYSLDLIKIYKNVTGAGGSIVTSGVTWAAFIAPLLGIVFPRYRYLKEIRR